MVPSHEIGRPLTMSLAILFTFVTLSVVLYPTFCFPVYHMRPSISQLTDFPKMSGVKMTSMGTITSVAHLQTELSTKCTNYATALQNVRYVLTCKGLIPCKAVVSIAETSLQAAEGGIRFFELQPGERSESYGVYKMAVVLICKFSGDALEVSWVGEPWHYSFFNLLRTGPISKQHAIANVEHIN